MPAKPNQTKPNHYFKKLDKKCFKYNKTGGRGRRSEGGKKRGGRRALHPSMPTEM
jgi:hypothetical protein